MEGGNQVTAVHEPVSREGTGSLLWLATALLLAVWWLW
jgi:hypothetical protein